MNLSNGKYLKYDILAFMDNWLIVFDGKYNYMVFNVLHPKEILVQYNRNRLPCNDFTNRNKMVEYYSNFDNAVDNMILNNLNNGFRC